MAQCQSAGAKMALVSPRRCQCGNDHAVFASSQLQRGVCLPCQDAAEGKGMEEEGLVRGGKKI